MFLPDYHSYHFNSCIIAHHIYWWFLPFMLDNLFLIFNAFYLMFLPGLFVIDFSYPLLHSTPPPWIIVYLLGFWLLWFICVLASVHRSALALINDSCLILLAFLRYLYPWLPIARASDLCGSGRICYSLRHVWEISWMFHGRREHISQNNSNFLKIKATSFFFQYYKIYL